MLLRLLLLLLVMATALCVAAFPPRRNITVLYQPPSSEQFLAELVNTPLLIRNLARDIFVLEDWTLASLVGRFPEIIFRHGAAPYPVNSRPISPHPELNEIFQFGTLPATFSLRGHGEACLPVYGMKYGFTAYIHDSGELACKLLRGVKIPGFIREVAPLIPLGGLIIGRTNATTAKHQHFAAINILLHGEKYWEMDGMDQGFIQRQGDVIYIPTELDHHVRNTRPSIAWTFQFHENHFGTNVGVPETEAILLHQSS